MKKINLRTEWKEYILLLRSIPSVVLALFVVSVVGMNLLANKSITLPVSWLALDCGIFLSWLSFLTMDILVKRFGPKAATEVSITASGINLLLCGVFAIISAVPGNWGESFVENGDVVNTALNNTFGGTWYILLGSTVAFLASSVINNVLNWFLGLKFIENSFKHYAIRSYVSTAISQFCDNLIFALIVSLNFFGWSLLQCIMCSVTGGIVELICEVIFSPFGFKVVTDWEKQDVGSNYIEYIHGSEGPIIQESN